MFRKLPTILFVYLFSLTLNLTFAQDLDDVTISGRISDSNGLAIAGANVKAMLIETGIERTVTTDDEGRYRIIELKPGLYKVTVSATGFGTKEKIDLQTISGQTVQ